MTTSPRNTIRRAIQNKVHFKGASNRLDPQTYDGNAAKDAKTYASELDGPKSRDEL